MGDPAEPPAAPGTSRHLAALRSLAAPRARLDLVAMSLGAFLVLAFIWSSMALPLWVTLVTGLGSGALLGWGGRGSGATVSAGRRVHTAGASAPATGAATSSPCSVDDCGRPVRARGLCDRHYSRWRKSGGTTPARGETPEDRFWDKVEKQPEPDGCWRWTGTLYGEAGIIYHEKRRQFAHRLAYAWFMRPLEGNEVLKRTCETLGCVRPEHYDVQVRGTATLREA